MKRLFIGLPIQSETAMQITRDWSNERFLNLNRLVWTKPGNWHITFFFLGTTPKSQIAFIEQLIDESFNEAPPITSELSGVGVFPEKGRPRILWMGLQNLEPLLPAYSLLQDLLLKNGFLFDPEPLKPHLTIARIKYLPHPTAIELLMNAYHSAYFGTIDINRVVLFESLSTKQGVIYEPLYEKCLLKVYS